MAKENYIPVSMLNSVSKLFEKLIQEQVNPFCDEKLIKYLCRYRKGNSTQYALLNFIDTINHDLLHAKLHADGVGKNNLKLMMSYLHNRYQRTKVNGEYSNWE